MRGTSLLIAWLAMFVCISDPAAAGMMFGTTSAGDLVTVDLVGGSSTVIGATGYTNISDLTFDDSGVLYGVDTDTDKLLTIDTSTGLAASVGTVGVGEIAGLAFDESGDLYAITQGNSKTSTPSQLAKLNKITGAGTPLTTLNGVFSELTLGPSGLLYTLGAGNLYSFDATMATTTEIGSLELSHVGVPGLSFDDRGTLIGFTEAARGKQLRTIDPTTGMTSVMTDYQGPRLSAITFHASTVPEPSTLGLVGFGAMGLVASGAGRRRQRKKQT